MNDAFRCRTPFAAAGLFVSGILIAVGTAWAYERGGLDFNVFHHAWTLVLSGQGSRIYADSPDRFLYAPGFAWLFAPLGLLSRDFSMLFWCVAKAAALGLMLSALGRRMVRGGARLAGWKAAGLAGWSLVLLARPLLVDFQYGQVNVFILAACVWAVIRHLEPGRPHASVIAWTVFSITAVAKIFPLPLLILPWLPGRPHPGRRWERLGTLIGCLLVLGIPFVAQGSDGAIALYGQWREALLSRGLPLESHNQSFAAFVHHFFSGEGTRVIARGSAALLNLGRPWLSPDSVSLLSWSWTLITTGVMLGWLLNRPASRSKDWAWLAMVIGLLIVPSHLIWKPYFVFGIPAAVCANGAAERTGRKSYLVALVLLFAFANLSGFDVIGAEWGARAEAASLLLACHLALLILSSRASGQAAGAADTADSVTL